MFYTIAKVFWVLAQPLSVVLLLVVMGIALVWSGRRRSGIAMSAIAAAILVLSAFTTTGALLIRPLEDRFSRPAALPETVGAIVVLGGSTLARVSRGRNVAELNEAGDRLVAATALAARYPEAMVVFSGGTGLLDPGEAEATTAARFFAEMGLAPERLVLEGQSRNTDENAELTAGMLKDYDGPIVLVTSAFHMPRSVGLFRREGLEVVPWPTDYRSAGTESFGIDLANPVNSLNVTSIAIKEWIGLAVYHWTGRIESMLPGQASN
jgi:uncharacterized SAM-binding protein YcdF (DUF218 family)